MLHSTLNYNYDWGLKHLQDWDGVIALTPQQQEDLQDRFGKFGVKIYRIPGPIVPAAVKNERRNKLSWLPACLLKNSKITY